MTVSTKSFDDLSLIGGRSSLDFVNSEGTERNGAPEWLESYVDTVMWAERGTALSPESAERLIDRARRDPNEARDVFERAVEIRETLYRLFEAAQRDAAPDEADLERFNNELRRAFENLRVVPCDGVYAWTFAESEALDSILWPIVYDAAELLSSDALDRVKRCESDTCNWLFLDVSRNRSRRWCKMGECGNRAKARRYYRRHKAGRGDTTSTA